MLKNDYSNSSGLHSTYIVNQSLHYMEISFEWFVRWRFLCFQDVWTTARSFEVILLELGSVQMPLVELNGYYKRGRAVTE